MSNYTGTIGGLTVLSGIKQVQSNGAISLTTNPPFTQGANSVYILSGTGAVPTTVTNNDIFIGADCGNTIGSFGNLGKYTVGIGTNCCQTAYGNDSVCIGNQAGKTNVPGASVAIGTSALGSNTSGGGGYNIGIGYNASPVNTAIYTTCLNSSSFSSTPSVANTTVINSGTSSLNPASSGLFIQPIAGRAAGFGVGRLGYDTTTKEVYYSTT